MLMNCVAENSFHRFKKFKFSYKLRWTYYFGILAAVSFSPALNPYNWNAFYARILIYIQAARIKWMCSEISILFHSMCSNAIVCACDLCQAITERILKTGLTLNEAKYVEMLKLLKMEFYLGCSDLAIR